MIFFDEIFMVAKPYRVLVADTKGLIISALVSLETRLKIPILAILDPHPQRAWSYKFGAVIVNV